MGGTWTDEYVRLRRGEDGIPDATRYRYRDPEIKQAVLEESYEKCIYCESKPRHVSPGDVEHLKPKAAFPELIVEWSNLGFVCPECNRAKGDFHDETEPIVNPYLEEPSDYLYFAGAWVFERPGNARGIVTIKKLALDRGSLVERRFEQIRAIQDLLNVWAALRDGAAKDEIAAEIRKRAEDRSEYAACIRSFFRSSGFV
jgi:hypothetical protein